MKRILIFSDTHGYIDGCISVINNSGIVSAVIHAGDCVRDAEDLVSIFPNIPVYYVQGNNDWFTRAPSEITVEIGGKKIFVTHGHEYGVKYEADFRTLVNHAKGADADLTVFGHTHMPYTAYEGKMTVINPGSIRFTKTYAIAEIDGDAIRTRLVEL